MVLAEEVQLPLINWHDDFMEGELQPHADGTGKRIILIALDTEYQSNHTANNNLCLSYQYALYSLFDGTYASGIFFPDVNKQARYSWSEFTHRVLKEAHLVLSELENFRIIFIAHFFSAEWAMFSDRKDLYMKFEYIRKSMVTPKPLDTTLLDENGEPVSCWVDVRDTMLLLPDGYRSLDKASTFLDGFEKFALESQVKANMYELLQKDPERFREYAIRDAEVTLKLFIKLQFMLNHINGTCEKIFLTLASATTTDFIAFSMANQIQNHNTHLMQFGRHHSLYQKYEALANRSYLGGLNSSYHLGKAEGYTFIDIDFKNAYPTAMNLIQIGDFGEPHEKKLKAKKVDLTRLLA